MVSFRILTVIFLAIVNFTFAQNGNIDFDKSSHDFGSIKEAKGKVKCFFNFVNNGSGDLKIKNVRPNCGCTVSNYTKETIPPGGKGFVSAIFDPANRKGNFDKIITVMTDAKKNPNRILHIKGNVIDKTKTKKDLYPQKIGNLWFKTNHHALMNIYVADKRTDTISFYNNSDKAINIKIKKIPVHITIKSSPEKIEAGAEAFFVFTYDASLKKEYDLVYDRITLFTDDDKQANKTLTISAIIKEDFTSISNKAMKKAPKIVFENTEYNFGKVKVGTKVKYSFVFTNKGKKTLIIRKTKASCGCTATKPAKTELKKGESSSIDIIFNTAGRKGKQHKAITVITNDPKVERIVLHVQGEIIE